MASNFIIAIRQAVEGLLLPAVRQLSGGFADQILPAVQRFISLIFAALLGDGSV